MARIGSQLAARADQRHVHDLAQARELTLVVQHDSLHSGALGNQASSQDLPPPELA
jgi:hypothetical protein